MKSDINLLQYICENLPKFPKVKIIRPLGTIETEVIGVRFNGKQPILSFKDYTEVQLGNSSEDIELIKEPIHIKEPFHIRDFSEGDELIDKNSHQVPKLESGKIYKVILKYGDGIYYWIFRYIETKENDIRVNGCVCLKKNEDNYSITYINNTRSVWGSADGIISLKLCDEVEGNAFSYIVDVLYHVYPVTEHWDEILKSINPVK